MKNLKLYKAKLKPIFLIIDTFYIGLFVIMNDECILKTQLDQLPPNYNDRRKYYWLLGKWRAIYKIVV